MKEKISVYNTNHSSNTFLTIEQIKNHNNLLISKKNVDKEFHYSLSTEKSESLVGSFFGKIWNLPNTIVGLLWGLAGVPFGAKISFDNNAIQFEKHPFMKERGGITIGNVISYGTSTGPQEIGGHEKQHTYQGQVLGPFYLLAHIYQGTEAVMRDGYWHGPSNDLEAGPRNLHNPNPWFAK